MSSFASGIASNANNADCTNSTLEKYNGTSSLTAQWTGNNINLHWYADEDATTPMTVASESQSCTYGGGLTPPATIPTKDGYTFTGWRVRGALPNGYTRLQYIQSTGTQYIDTGVAFDNPNVEIYTKVSRNSAPSGEKNIISSYRSGARTGSMALGFVGSTIFLYSRDSSNKDTNISTAFDTGDAIIVAKYDFTAGKKYLTVNGITSEQDYSHAITGTYNVVMFSNPSNEFRLSAKMYYMVFYVNGILVRNFIPAKDSNNVVGMWDTVTQTFFTNAGSGSFTAGPVIQ